MVKNKIEEIALYSIKDNSDGLWICFSDGHNEYWSNERIKYELSYRGLEFIKTQIKLTQQKTRDEIFDKILKLKLRCPQCIREDNKCIEVYAINELKNKSEELKHD